MAKYSGSGWHFQSTRHSNARKYGKAGGRYKTFDISNIKGLKKAERYKSSLENKGAKVETKLIGTDKVKIKHYGISEYQYMKNMIADINVNEQDYKERILEKLQSANITRKQYDELLKEAEETPVAEPIKNYGKTKEPFKVGDKVFWSVNKNKIIFGEIIKVYDKKELPEGDEDRIRVKSSDGQEYEPVTKYVHKEKKTRNKKTKEEIKDKELYNKKELSEKEVNLIKLRLNSGKIKIQDLKTITEGEGYELSEAQAQKGLAWLRNKGFKMNREPKSKTPFGYREEAVVTKPLNETKFYLRDFYEENNFHYPVYVIKNSGGAFEYYVKGGEIQIIG